MTDAPGTLARQLGEILAAERFDRSRNEIADDLGIGPVPLLRLEQGKANPTLARVERIAAAYGIELEFRVKD